MNTYVYYFLVFICALFSIIGIVQAVMAYNLTITDMDCVSSSASGNNLAKFYKLLTAAILTNLIVLDLVLFLGVKNDIKIMTIIFGVLVLGFLIFNCYLCFYFYEQFKNGRKVTCTLNNSTQAQKLKFLQRSYLGMGIMNVLLVVIVLILAGHKMVTGSSALKMIEDNPELILM